jgi:GTPase SAR1 family protein
MKTSKKEHYDYLYKSIYLNLDILLVILVGDPSVGKTSFLIRLTKNVISKPPQPTVGIEYATQSILLQNGEGIVKA